MKKAIGYIRVSTDKQSDEGISLEAQGSKIRAWAELNDYELIEIRSEAISGCRSDRPELAEAIRIACENSAALVVYSLSRFSRSTRDTIDLSEKLSKSSADLVSLSEKIDTTTAAGKMVFRMLAVMAEFERDQVSERTSAAMQHMKKKGLFTGGRAPYGYRAEKKGRIFPIESEQRIIGYAKQMRDAGKSYRQICQILSSHDLVSRTGATFQPTQIKRMIDQSFPIA